MLRLGYLVVLGVVLLGFAGCGGGNSKVGAWGLCECPAMVEGVLKLTTEQIQHRMMLHAIEAAAQAGTRWSRCSSEIESTKSTGMELWGSVY